MEAVGGWTPSGWASPAAIQQAAAGGPACCSSFSNPSNPCGSCYAGSSITHGWCVDEEEHCTAHCSGSWCPSGISQLFEPPRDLPEVLAPHPARLTGPMPWAVVPLLFVALPAAAWLRALRQRGQVPVEVHGLLAPGSDLEPVGEMVAAA